MKSEFTKNVIKIIKSIPESKVLTYGAIAAMAGNPYGARQVSWILHNFTKKYNLPWHRVISSKGMISIPKGQGYDKQKELLLKEGIEFSDKNKIDLKLYFAGY
jgi:methylated-DNA-protein-cysteine methyltransferase-like protein